MSKELEVYEEALRQRDAVEHDTLMMSEIVMRGARMLEENPSSWVFSTAPQSSEPNRHAKFRVDIEEFGTAGPISSLTWPHVGALLELKQRYVAAEKAVKDAFAALPEIQKRYVQAAQKGHQ